MATDCGLFLKFVVVLATTTWFTCPPLTNEETVLISEMAEELQLEIKSQIYAVDWSSLGRIAEFLKVEHEDKSNLAEAKHVVQRLEEELGKKGSGSRALSRRREKVIDGKGFLWLAVIRSITPGAVLRSYLETYKDLTLDRLKKIYHQALSSICQSPKESPQAFLMNALDLRQQILFTCSDKDDDTFLQ